MKYRIRLLLLFLALGILPLAISGWLSVRQIRDAQVGLSTEYEGVLRRVFEAMVKDRVELITSQVQQYASQNPDISLIDRSVMRDNPSLALFFNQTNQTGLNIMFYTTDTYVLYHTDSSLIGKNLFLEGKLPADQMKLISQALPSQDVTVAGYFTQEGEDGQAQQIYFTTRRVPIAPVLIAVWGDVNTYYQVDAVALASITQTSLNEAVLSVVLVLSGLGILLFIVILVVNNLLVTPVEWMAQSGAQLLRFMQSISKNMQIPEFKNEFALLNHTFMVLSRQFRELVTNLEGAVRERTGELTRRTEQLETAAQLSRESAAILDIDLLLNQTTYLISERFGFYHTGIFLIDQNGEYAILRAANSEGGQRMLSRSHRLRVGQGVVGSAASKKEAVIASDTGKDAVHFKNPDLPFTRSELALPLKIRDRVIGVLDVQSTDPNAFSEDDVRILQILGDQLALAIENARLFKQSQQTLQELEVAYGQQTLEAWQRTVQSKSLGFVYDRLDVLPMQGNASIEADPAHEKGIVTTEQYHILTVPLLVRNQSLGSITMRRALDETPWSSDDLVIAQETATQVASALENARLLEEIQRRAHQESLVGQVATKVQASLDVETVLKTAVREVARSFAATKVQIRLGADAPSRVVVSGNGHSPTAKSQ